MNVILQNNSNTGIVLDDIDGLSRTVIPGMGINQLFGVLITTLTNTNINAGKVYVGSTTASINISKLVLGGITMGDKVTLTGFTGTFADRNVPNISSVTYNWSYSGTGITINGTTNAVKL